MAEPDSLEGGCHCGAVRFRVRVRERTAIVCNCSMCRKKANLALIVSRGDFELLRGESELVDYRFHTRVACHRFCRHCGIHPFYTPRSHPEDVSVNLHCLDEDVEPRFAIESFDGVHWEESIEALHRP